MQNKRRLLLGEIFFALLFFYLGVRVYFVFFHVGSYDGWTSKRPDSRALIIAVDPKGPATAVRINDALLAINGITLAQDLDIANYYRRIGRAAREYALLQ